jgi:hypothetical protein
MIEIKRRKGSDDYAAVTMSLDFSVPDRVEQMGFLAHRCGVYRQDNPYTDLVDPSSAPASARAATALEEAWWRGWDRASAETSSADRLNLWRPKPQLESRRKPT